MAFYTIVKKLPKNVKELELRKGMFYNEKYIYEEGESAYYGCKVYYRHKMK